MSNIKLHSVIQIQLPINTTFNSQPVTLTSPKFAIGQKVWLRGDETDHPDDWANYYVGGVFIDWGIFRHDETAHTYHPEWKYLVSNELGGIYLKCSGIDCEHFSESELMSQDEFTAFYTQNERAFEVWVHSED